MANLKIKVGALIEDSLPKMQFANYSLQSYVSHPISPKNIDSYVKAIQSFEPKSNDHVKEIIIFNNKTLEEATTGLSTEDYYNRVLISIKGNNSKFKKIKINVVANRFNFPEGKDSTFPSLYLNPDKNIVGIGGEVFIDGRTEPKHETLSNHIFDLPSILPDELHIPFGIKAYSLIACANMYKSYEINIKVSYTFLDEFNNPLIFLDDFGEAVSTTFTTTFESKNNVTELSQIVTANTDVAIKNSLSPIIPSPLQADNAIIMDSTINGTLKYKGTPVVNGMVVNPNDIESGELIYTSPSESQKTDIISMYSVKNGNGVFRSLYLETN